MRLRRRVHYLHRTVEGGKKRDIQRHVQVEFDLPELKPHRLHRILEVLDAEGRAVQVFRWRGQFLVERPDLIAEDFVTHCWSRIPHAPYRSALFAIAHEFGLAFACEGKIYSVTSEPYLNFHNWSTSRAGVSATIEVVTRCLHQPPGTAVGLSLLPDLRKVTPPLPGLDKVLFLEPDAFRYSHTRCLGYAAGELRIQIANLLWPESRQNEEFPRMTAGQVRAVKRKLRGEVGPRAYRAVLVRQDDRYALIAADRPEAPATAYRDIDWRIIAWSVVEEPYRSSPGLPHAYLVDQGLVKPRERRQPLSAITAAPVEESEAFSL